MFININILYLKWNIIIVSKLLHAVYPSSVPAWHNWCSLLSRSSSNCLVCFVWFKTCCIIKTCILKLNCENKIISFISYCFVCTRYLTKMWGCMVENVVSKCSHSTIKIKCDSTKHLINIFQVQKRLKRKNSEAIVNIVAKC